MSTLGLFALGAVVTVIVGLALALLIWGAILDGRYEEAHQRATEAGGTGRPSPHPAPERTAMPTAT